MSLELGGYPLAQPKESATNTVLPLTGSIVGIDRSYLINLPSRSRELKLPNPEIHHTSLFVIFRFHSLKSRFAYFLAVP
jgi:hypothetical protein